MQNIFAHLFHVFQNLKSRNIVNITIVYPKLDLRFDEHRYALKDHERSFGVDGHGIRTTQKHSAEFPS